MSTSSELTGREAVLCEVAMRAWTQAVADFYHPPLPEPTIEYIPERGSYFYIDSKTWTVHLNTAGVPASMGSNDSEWYLRSICHHEIEHYLLCPYDGVTSGMMFASAHQHLDQNLSMFVCNLFADLVVDSHLLARFASLTHERMKTTIYESSLMTSDHSALWSLTVACHRAMWGFPVPASVRIDDRTLEAATGIVEIAHEAIDRDASWPKAVGRIAAIVREWLPEDEGELLTEAAAEGGSGDEATAEVSIPKDLDAVLGNPLETRNGDLARKCMEGGEPDGLEEQMERLAMEVENRGGHLGDLEAVYMLAGIGDKEKTWVRFWYRAKARGLVRIDIRERKMVGAVPLAIQTWRLGDPIEELDLVQSLQAFPVLVPNMSTRKWARFEEGIQQEVRTYPDLLLVIDSSGSMTWAMKQNRVSGPYHTALVSAFAALDFASSRGERVGAINFSDGIKMCDFTTDRRDVERVLLAYQGGGTIAPIEAIVSMCESKHDRTLILIITDAELANWKKTTDAMRRLRLRGHTFFLFHISRGDHGGVVRDIEDAGGAVIPVERADDLPGLVIGRMKQVYSD